MVLSFDVLLMNGDGKEDGEEVEEL